MSDLKITGQQALISHTPETDAEGQTITREYRTEAQASMQGAPSPMAAVTGNVGNLPTIIQYQGKAGEMANAARTACVGCIAQGTLVLSNAGMLPIEKVVELQAQQTFIDGRWTPIAAHVFTGVKEVVEVTTTRGLKFRCTPDHRIMTDHGWVSAADLRTEFRPNGTKDNRHIIDAPARFQLSYDDALSRESALLVGMLTGDGWVARENGGIRGVGFCWAEDMSEAWQPVLDYARDVLESDEKARVDLRVRPGELVRCLTPQPLHHIVWRNKQAKALGAWLDKAHVPQELWRSTPGAIGAYLRGLFSTDGSIGLSPIPTVSFYQTSESLIHEVQLLLRTLGIYSTVHRSIRAPKYKDLFQLRVARQESLENFIDLVGFVDSHRRLPLEAAVMARRGKEKKWTERAASVVSCGYEKVYDLSVPGPEAFLANGVKVHNCKHWDNKAMLQFIRNSEGPASTAEDRLTLKTMRDRVTKEGFKLEEFGICRVLSDWVEQCVGRDPFFWPSVSWREATCPNVCNAGKFKLDVVTPAEPFGLFSPVDMDAQKIGANRYDAILKTVEQHNKR